MEDLKITNVGAEIGGEDHYLDIDWTKFHVEIEVYQSNGYDENQASSITITTAQFDAIIKAYQNSKL